LTLNELRRRIAAKSPYDYRIAVHASDYEGDNVSVRVDVGRDTYYASGKTLERALETLFRVMP